MYQEALSLIDILINSRLRKTPNRINRRANGTQLNNARHQVAISALRLSSVVRVQKLRCPTLSNSSANKPILMIFLLSFIHLKHTYMQ